MENFILINFHRTRDFSQKMNVTFDFIRQNFKPLMKSIFLIAGPPALIASLFMGTFFQDFLTASMMVGRGDENPFMTLGANPTFWAQLILAMIFFMLSSVATVATVNNYLLLYEEKSSSDIKVTQVWERVRSTFGMYLGTTILFYLLIVALYIVMVLAIAGIAALSPVLAVFGGIGIFCGFFYLVVGTLLIYIVRTYERVGFFEAISRSFFLIRGKWWSTLGIFFVLYLIVVIVSYIFMIPSYVISMIASLHQVGVGGVGEPGETQKLIGVISFTLYYVAQMLMYSLPNVGLAFQYFNLVERKEAKGLLGQIDTIGQSGPTPSNTEEHY